MKSRIKAGVIWTIIGVTVMGAQANENTLNVHKQRDSYRVQILEGGKVSLSSPAEGLWSIAMDWQDAWPSTWMHGQATELETAANWTILKGQVQTPQGHWLVRDAYQPIGKFVKCVRRFTWQGKQTAESVTLSVRFVCPGRGQRVLMPGIMYYGNPSGAQSGRVPVYTGIPGEALICEEHRFPMPYASLEWAEKDKLNGAALHSMPCPVPGANRDDQWWSLGVTALEHGTEFSLLSGPCTMNGKRSLIKGGQRDFVTYDHAYLKVEPGTVIEKTFYLEAYPVQREGSGFQRPTRTSLGLFRPWSVEEMPGFAEILAGKYRYAKSRWHETGKIAGFAKFANRPYFVFGWCGQAAACGYAFQVLSDELGDQEVLDMAQQSLDFICANARFYDKGFYTWYDYDKDQWVTGRRPEWLSQGQAMYNVANAIRVARIKGLACDKWETFLKRACDFHAQRILSNDWHSESTNEAFFIGPLCKAFGLLGHELYQRAALKAGQVYAQRHVSMREPYWGGTLDASCEDKEGAFAALQGFLELYEMTGKAQWLERAEHACDVALTYVVVWDIDLPAGRLRNHGFKTRGWTAVSVQNMHIDVYGVLIAPDVYRLGQLTKQENLKKTALLMYRSCGQLMDPYGSQGEQPHQTNYAQHGEFREQIQQNDMRGVRGNYVENWTVFWITAHFLNAAAEFKELGVTLTD
jgi:hypothetical protein